MEYGKFYLESLPTFCHAYRPIIRPTITPFNLNGSITGTILPGYRNEFLEAFLGIPFAEPPIGQLRFADPVPFENFWSYDHMADQEQNMCIQKNYVFQPPEITGSEDCLYLNIYRPIGTSDDKLLPVIIKVHGGAFFSGSASPQLYGPKYFMDNGEVILITIQYRLGPFGFLSTGDNEIAGNFALKDQALALKWIKENIIVFNGDPNAITLFGQSAGAVSVHLHMMSPISQNLFDRVVLTSGTGVAPFADVLKNPLEQARELAKWMGVLNSENLSVAELAQIFRTTDPNIILDAASEFRIWTVDPMVVFKPVIESADNPNAFLTEDPRVLLATGNYRNVPLLLVTVPEEGTIRSAIILTNETQLEMLNENFNLVLSLQNYFDLNDPLVDSKIDQIVDFYLNGSRNIGWHNAQQYTNMISDRTFFYPYFSTYKYYTKTVDPVENPVYLLNFNYRGPYSFSIIFTGTFIDFGVIHGDDLLYLFDTAFFPLFDLDSVEADLITEMVDIFVNFASGRVPHEQSVVCTFDEQDPDRPCPYLNIVNAGNGYSVETSEVFNLDMVNFWRGIDRLF